MTRGGRQRCSRRPYAHQWWDLMWGYEPTPDLRYTLHRRAS